MPDGTNQERDGKRGLAALAAWVFPGNRSHKAGSADHGGEGGSVAHAPTLIIPAPKEHTLREVKPSGVGQRPAGRTPGGRLGEL